MKKKVKFLVTAGLVTLVGGFFLIRKMNPLMNDITTNLQSPPAFFAASVLILGKELSYPEEFADMQRKFYPNIAPKISDKSATDVYEAAKKIAVEKFDWEILEESNSPQGEFKFHAVATTKVGFKDDIVVVVKSEENEGVQKSVVNVRSKSRLGKSDFGTNAQRIQEFLTSL